MSEIKPVYQYKTAGMLINYWQDIDEEAFIKLSKDHCYTTRILYPAAAYEALENERDELKQSLDDLQERFNGIKFIESELRKENDSLNAEVLRLKNELIASLKDWHDMNANHEALQKENNSLKLGYKAKEIILQEAQKEVAKLRSFDADNKGLKECNSILTAENEAQAKRIAELESEDEISAAVIEKCSHLLSSIAVTLKGEQKELSRHSHHDLPELVSVLHLENELNKQRITELEETNELLQTQVHCLEMVAVSKNGDSK